VRDQPAMSHTTTLTVLDVAFPSCDQAMVTPCSGQGHWTFQLPLQTPFLNWDRVTRCPDGFRAADWTNN
jgi:hypothetical protein